MPESDVKLMERLCLPPQHRVLGGKKQNETSHGGSSLCTDHFHSVTSTFNSSLRATRTARRVFSQGMSLCCAAAYLARQQGDAEQLHLQSKIDHPFPRLLFFGLGFGLFAYALQLHACSTLPKFGRYSIVCLSTQCIHIVCTYAGNIIHYITKLHIKIYKKTQEVCW